MHLSCTGAKWLINEGLYPQTPAELMESVTFFLHGLFVLKLLTSFPSLYRQKLLSHYLAIPDFNMCNMQDQLPAVRKARLAILLNLHEGYSRISSP